jgi:hypothetical protein
MRKSLKYNQMEVKVLIDVMMSMTPKEMKQLLSEKNITMIELCHARQVMNAAGGDRQSLEFLLDRLVGKVKDKLEVQQPRPTVIKRRNGEAVELGTTQDDRND